MVANQKKYTDEFRRETADYVISTGRPITQVCGELGLNPKTVNDWVLKRKRELGGRARPEGRGARASRGEEAHTRARGGERVPNKSRGLLRQRAGTLARYRLMEAEKGNFTVAMMAKVLGVSRSGHCSWVSNGCPVDDWSEARDAVRRVWLESDRRFGARFVKCFLPDGLRGITLYRVRKCMRELGIRGCTPYKSKRTTVPDRDAKPRPDLIRRDFTSPVPTYKLVGDITYLRTPARAGSTCRR